jgi:hypothetical protein
MSRKDLAWEKEEKRMENREQLLLLCILTQEGSRVGRGRKENGEQRAVTASLHPDAGRISPETRKKREWRTESSYCFFAS